MPPQLYRAEWQNQTAAALREHHGFPVRFARSSTMHNHNVSFQQIMDPPMEENEPESSPIPPTRSGGSFSLLSKKKKASVVSPTSTVRSSGTLSPSSFRRRKKENPLDVTETTTSTVEDSPPPRSVNPNKGIMHIDDAEEVVALPKRASSSTTGGRRDSFFRIRSSLPNKNKPSSSTDLSVEETTDEDDPVVALFTARNTSKVRFSLGEVEPTKVPSSPHRVQGDDDTKYHSSSDGSPPRSAKRNSASSTDPTKFNIKKFMKGALFGSGGQKTKGLNDFELEFEREMEEAALQNNEMIWSTQEDGIPEVLRTTKSNPDAQSTASADGVKVSFAETIETRAVVIKLINKARRAQFLHFRYGYAVKCYVRALEILRESQYPDDHPTVLKTMKLLQSAHYANSSYNNSANIVKLGIKYEDAGELVRALKMYTIAYRIRREALSPSHPSLVVILNMLGSIQIKRGELDEAMAIYELALKDTEPVTSPGGNSSGDDNNSIYSASGGAAHVSTNYVTRAVTYREMGTIYEQWGEADRALRMYHKSLDCMAEYKGLKQQNQVSTLPWEAEFSEEKKEDDGKMHGHNEILHDLEATHLTSNSKGARSSKSQPRSSMSSRRNDRSGEVEDPMEEENGMELTFGDSGRRGRKVGLKPLSVVSKSRYDIFFPLSLDEKKRKNRLPVGGGNKKNRAEEQCLGDHTDVDVALTIHRIAQLHRARQEYHLALPAFYVSLRGMKFALGKSHPNVAAILGNIGNLQKEMGDMDSAYTTYQQVLAIESYRLGLSHPDVVVTLHNISTIDAARGNLDHALSLYTQVVSLQRKLFGEDHESVAVTSACMGDVYERLGDVKSAVECYEEALRIKIAALGRHSLEVARLLHKLGKLAVSEEDFHLAHSYISKAILVYRLNKLRDDDEWVIDVHRDAADVDAAIAMGRGGDIFEC